MIAYSLRRLGTVSVLLLVMSAVVFIVTTHLPGDPAVTVLGIESSASEREIVRERLGLNDPLPVQYVRWLKRATEGDLGRSIRTHEPVGQMLAARAPITIELTILAMALAIAVGVPAGIAAAKLRGSFVDSALSGLALVATAIPFFWLGILLILLFSLKLRWLPPSGYVAFAADPVNNLRLMVLPALAVGLSMAALITRQTRSAVLQVLSEDYVRTARAKGLPESRVLFGHAMPNSMIPVLTVIGLQTGALLGGAIVTERVFSIAGIGTMLIDGIFNRDFPVIQGAMLFIIFCVAAVNLIVDILYSVIDPRIRY
jgi:peptide/nickel transport system permease protein